MAASMVNDIRTVGVIGAGQMGNGIAHVCALAGYDVLLSDADATRIDAALYLDAIAGDSRARAAGLAVTTTAALIGLSPLSLTAFGGWDFAEDAPFLRMKVGALFGDR